MASAISLTSLATTGGTLINASDTSLAALVGTLGPDSTSAELLNVQMELAKNGLITATFSAFAKERAETLKFVVQKF